MFADLDAADFSIMFNRSIPTCDLQFKAHAMFELGQHSQQIRMEIAELAGHGSATLIGIWKLSTLVS